MSNSKSCSGILIPNLDSDSRKQAILTDNSLLKKKKLREVNTIKADESNTYHPQSNEIVGGLLNNHNGLNKSSKNQNHQINNHMNVGNLLLNENSNLTKITHNDGNNINSNENLPVNVKKNNEFKNHHISSGKKMSNQKDQGSVDGNLVQTIQSKIHGVNYYNQNNSKNPNFPNNSNINSNNPNIASEQIMLINQINSGKMMSNYMNNMNLNKNSMNMNIVNQNNNISNQINQIPFIPVKPNINLSVPNNISNNILNNNMNKNLNIPSYQSGMGMNNINILNSNQNFPINNLNNIHQFNQQNIQKINTNLQQGFLGSNQQNLSSNFIKKSLNFSSNFPHLLNKRYIENKRSSLAHVEISSYYRNGFIPVVSEIFSKSHSNK